MVLEANSMPEEAAKPMPPKPGAAKGNARSAFHDVTPSRLLLLLVAIWLSAILFCIAAIVTVQQHKHAAQTVGLDAAPSVIAAHRISTGVLKMDTDLADELILNKDQYGAQGRAKDFEKYRTEVANELVAAARNITYETEQIPIQNIQVALGEFEMRAQATRDAHRFGTKEEAIKAYLGALQSLQENIIPNADALDKANIDVLEDTFAREKGASAMSRGLVLVIGMVLVSLLLYTQVFLMVRFHRRISPPLLLCTICAAFLVQHLSSDLGASSRNLVVAKEDAYDSVVALLDALSDSWQANAAKSRWLLDREHAAIHQKTFDDSISKVAKFAPGGDFKQTLALAQKQFSDNEKLNLPDFSGSLAVELNNVRFPREREAALEALQDFGQFSDEDGRMRKEAKAGNFDTAARMGLGFDPDSSNYFFSKYEDALERTLKINEDQLNSAVRLAIKDLDGLVTGATLLSILVIACSYLSLRPRIEEYQTTEYLHRRH